METLYEGEFFCEKVIKKNITGQHTAYDQTLKGNIYGRYIAYCHDIFYERLWSDE